MLLFCAPTMCCCCCSTYCVVVVAIAPTVCCCCSIYCVVVVVAAPTMYCCCYITYCVLLLQHLMCVVVAAPTMCLTVKKIWWWLIQRPSLKMWKEQRLEMTQGKCPSLTLLCRWQLHNEAIDLLRIKSLVLNVCKYIR